LCYAGLLLFLLALISFGAAWRIGIDEDNSPELITSGIFEYSRDPIFLFLDLYFAGIMLIYPNILFILQTAFTNTTGRNIFAKKFGALYTAYQTRARFLTSPIENALTLTPPQLSPLSPYIAILTKNPPRANIPVKELSSKERGIPWI
jgi:hypothetical protein